METATRVLLLASLFAAGCSSEVGPENATPGNSTDPNLGSSGPVSSTGGPAPVVTGSNGQPVTQPTGTNGQPLPPATGSNGQPVPPPTGTGSSTGGPIDPPPPPPAGSCEVSASSQVPRLLNRQYDHVVRDLLGVTTLENGQPPSSMLVTDLEGNITSTAWKAYMDAAEAVAAEVMAGPNRANFIACEPAEDGCLRTTVETFGRKAFRRPLTTEEVDSFMRLDAVDPPGTPEEVAEAILFAFLASPSFLTVGELTETADPALAGHFVLSDHEVAARLALLVWGSMPDQILSDAADAGELRTREQIVAQAQRMAAIKEKTGPLLASFHNYYAQIGADPHWGTVDHDEEQFAHFNDNVNETAMKEMTAFFGEVAFEGSFKDILLSPIAYVNKDTAAIYGLNPADFGDELEKVTLDEQERPGFLTRAGFLSSFSRLQATSPILRGAYINKNVIGINPGVPSDDARNAVAPPGDYKTEREYTDALTSPEECADCHLRVINPPGYVFEMYDAVGKVQTMDPLGGPINATAQVVLSNGAKEITSPHQLMTEIAAGEGAKLLYAEKWVTYVTRRSQDPNDACVAERLSLLLAQDGYPIVNVLADLSQSEFIRLRTVGE